MKQPSNLHFIRKHILRVLAHTDWAKFSDMQPNTVDSNVYSYHLRELVKEQYVEHDAQQGYRLSPFGMRLVDHVSIETFEPRWQPKLLTMLVIIDDRRLLLWPKYKQPFCGCWSLPSGKVHFEDTSIETAALREASFVSSEPPCSVRHCGVVEFVGTIHGETVSHTVSHVFMITMTPESVTHPRVHWIELDTLPDVILSPGTREIIQAVQEKTDFFYMSLTLG